MKLFYLCVVLFVALVSGRCTKEQNVACKISMANLTVCENGMLKSQYYNKTTCCPVCKPMKGTDCSEYPECTGDMDPAQRDVNGCRICKRPISRWNMTEAVQSRWCSRKRICREDEKPTFSNATRCWSCKPRAEEPKCEPKCREGEKCYDLRNWDKPKCMPKRRYKLKLKIKKAKSVMRACARRCNGQDFMDCLEELIERKCDNVTANQTRKLLLCEKLSGLSEKVNITVSRTKDCKNPARGNATMADSDTANDTDDTDAEVEMEIETTEEVEDALVEALQDEDDITATVEVSEETAATPVNWASSVSPMLTSAVIALGFVTV